MRHDRRGPIWLGALPLGQLLFLGTRTGSTQAYYFFLVVLFCFVLAAATVVRLAEVWARDGGQPPQ